MNAPDGLRGLADFFDLIDSEEITVINTETGKPLESTRNEIQVDLRKWANEWEKNT